MFCLVETATDIDTVNETVTEITTIDTIDTTEKADIIATVIDANNTTSAVVTENRTIAEESNTALNVTTALSGSDLSNITTGCSLSYL